MHVKSTLSSLPMYFFFLSIFISCHVGNQMMNSNFNWWFEIQSPLRCIVLGIRKLSIFYQVLLSKLSWCFVEERDHFREKIYCFKIRFIYNLFFLIADISYIESNDEFNFHLVD